MESFLISEVPGFVLPLSSVHLVALIPKWHIWWCKIFFAAIASVKGITQALKAGGLGEDKMGRDK